MKKFLKYLGIGLGSLLLVAALVIGGLYFYYKDWAQFYSYIKHNDIVSMQKMLDDGYNINKHLKYYNINHLQLAIVDSDVVNNETIEFLITNGININFANINKITPFIETMIVRRADIAKLLLDNGANLDVIFNNRTITEMAIIAKLPEFIMLIPEDKISVGPNFIKEPYLTERVLKFYKEGKTDKRVINYLQKNNLLQNE